MPKGVKIKNNVLGDGREARRGDVVVVNLSAAILLYQEHQSPLA